MGMKYPLKRAGTSTPLHTLSTWHRSQGREKASEWASLWARAREGCYTCPLTVLIRPACWADITKSPRQLTSLTDPKRVILGSFLTHRGCRSLFPNTHVSFQGSPLKACLQEHLKHSCMLLCPTSPLTFQLEEIHTWSLTNMQVWEAARATVLSNETLEALSYCGNSRIPFRCAHRLK